MDDQKECKVVVSGAPRSGTSLMMQMLVAGGLKPISDGRRQADASNPRGYLEHDGVRTLKQDASWLHESDGQVLKVVHVLLDDLPRRPAFIVVFMRRPISQIIASQRAMLERLGKPVPVVPDEQMSALLSQQIDTALRRVHERPNLIAIEVDYPELIRDPPLVVPSVAELVRNRIGVDLDQQAMQRSVDPTLHRERQR